MRIPIAPLAAVVLMLGCLISPAEDKKEVPKAALLGLESRAATKEEKDAFKLGDALAGRVNGTIVETLAKDGPAEKAGILAGDAILALDDSRLYSNDDLDDFVRSAKPGQKVKALLRRAGTKKEETVEVTLGETAAPKGPHIAWQFAGPAQMDAALALAKKEGRKVMVGVSGAET